MQDKKCKKFGLEYPMCTCKQCLRNIVELDGIKKGDVFTYNGYFTYLNNKKVKIVSINPFTKKYSFRLLDEPNIKDKWEATINELCK